MRFGIRRKNDFILKTTVNGVEYMEKMTEGLPKNRRENKEITRDSIIIERIFLVQWKISILTNILPNILKIAFIVIGIW